jgi:hypothetical protein
MATSKGLKSESLENVFESLHKLLSRYAPPLKACGGNVRGKRDFHLTVPKAVVVPGAYGGKAVEIELASIILQKGFVGFYLMPLYVDPGIKKKLAPSLTKQLKGKTCFHIKQVDSEVLGNIEDAVTEGMKSYKERGWL